MTRRISFVTLWIENFKAISTPIAINLTDYSPGCHAVRGINKYKPRMGSNGVSKSSLWDAFCFVLYGKTPRGKRGPVLVPWGQKINPTVILAMEIDGEPYHIHRTASPHKLIVNETVVEQAYLDQLLGIPFEIFTNTVLLAQGRSLFLDMTPTAKLAMLTEVLNLQRWDTYSKEASGQAHNLRDEEQQLLLEDARLTGQITALKEQIAQLDQQSATFEATKAKDIAFLKSELTRVKAEQGIATQEAEHIRLAMATYEKKVTTLENDFAEAYQHWHAVNLAHTEHRHLYDQRARMLEHANAKCPTCGQHIDARLVKVQIDAIDKILNKLPDLSEAKDRHDKASQATEAYRRQSYGFMQKYYRIEAHLLQAKRIVEQAEARLDRAERTNDPYATNLSIAGIKLKTLSKTQGVLTGKLDKLAMDRERFDTWAEAFKVIKLLEVEDLLDTLSLLTSSYAGQLGLECNAHFSVEREGKRGAVIRGINITVDGIADIEAWSVGEGQRLRLAASMALAQSLLEAAGVSIPLRILDEPSAHLSPEGLKELAAFLDRYGRDENMAVFLTDQRPVSGVTSTITITRTPDGVDLS